MPAWDEGAIEGGEPSGDAVPDSPHCRAPRRLMGGTLFGAQIVRSIVAAVAAALLVLTSLTASAGSVLADSTGAPPKVVVVVGPVGSLSDMYRSDGEAAAVVARQYTPNVVTLYTPNATWAAVSGALQGASIVIYLGHGNGFPSPYSSTLIKNNFDGLGLNPVAGGDDTTTKYYGEAYLESSVRLAPNAIVILSHLCYASGNSEPQNPPPTLDVAQQRVDNMAAGWMAAGARAVIAEGHAGPASYVQALFATSQPIDPLWRGAPTFHNNVLSFPSTRTIGAVAEMDPDQPTGGYYRSMVFMPGLTSDQVVGRAAGSAPAATPPPSVYPAPPSVPPTPTPAPVPAPSQPPSVAPGGGAPPILALAAATSPMVFSPNGDGRADTVAVPYTINEAGYLDGTVMNAAGAPVRSLISSVHAGAGRLVWDGRDNAGTVVPDGFYTISVTGIDDAGSSSAPQAARVAVDTALSRVTSSTSVFYPQDGDRYARSATLGYTLTSPATVRWVVADAAGAVVRTLSAGVPIAPGTVRVAWDGRSDAGSFVPPGTYYSTVTATSGQLSITDSVAVTADAFRLTPSTTSPRRGSVVTLTIVSPEPLASAPVVTISQPGFTPARVTAVRLSGSTYRATYRLRTGRASGNVILQVQAIDAGAGMNAAVLRLTLR